MNMKTYLNVLLVITVVVFSSILFWRLNRSPRVNIVTKTQIDTNNNPFGVMFANTDKVKIAKELGANYYRPMSIFVNKWNGGCAECDAAVRAGLKLVLTVRNNGGPQIPTTFPTDINAYKKTLAEIVDKYNPVVLIIENEENSEALFYSGTPDQYHTQLRAGCEVAHAKGIKCSNGGFVSSLVALLVTENYLRNGKTDAANEYIKRTLGPKLEEQYGSENISATQLLAIPKAKAQLIRGHSLLAGYKQTGADYINIHWYIADTPALEEAVSYMGQAIDLPVITNEIGQQKNTDQAQVTAVMKKIVDLNIPIAIWFSVDVPGYGEAKSLVDENGNLRPNGEAYRDFILH